MPIRTRSGRLKKPTHKAQAAVEGSKTRSPASTSTRSIKSQLKAKQATRVVRKSVQSKTSARKTIAPRLSARTTSMRSARSAESASSPSRIDTTHAGPSPSSSTSRSRGSSSTLVEPQESTPRRKVTSATPTSSNTLKRKRALTIEKEEEVRVREERLKVAEKKVREHESALKKLQAAANKKRNEAQRAMDSLARKREEMERRIKLYEQKQREVEQEAKAVETRNKAIEAREKTLRKKLPRELVPPGDSSLPTEAGWALDHLEEHYTCSLCYDILACPYTLTPRLCGHSFCALCILQWNFAAVHRACGYWHEALECPLCRAELPYTSENVPRSMFAFPFTPNRIADNAIRALIEKIRDAKPESDGSGRNGGGSAPGAAACANAGQGRSGMAMGLAFPKESERLSGWKENGALYLDWKERNRRGRTEMSFFATEWAMLEANDFVAFKDRLGV